MRLWTLHPRYLDAKGLVALWREGLLAQKVLRGGTKGYRHHPQLIRFLATRSPGAAIATYLAEVYAEAARRGYAFDAAKIARRRSERLIEATDGQLKYEWLHLRRKLQRRDPKRHKETRSIKLPEAHPIFRIVGGDIHDWERVMG